MTTTPTPHQIGVADMANKRAEARREARREAIRQAAIARHPSALERYSASR